MGKDIKEILITGGTSGLGKELVKYFLKDGFHVIATGRQAVSFPGFEDKFRLYLADFSDLRAASEVFREIGRTFEPDYVINNAGILSPPGFSRTKDGHEVTFQVNFLAHLLLNEIIIARKNPSKPLIIAATTSPVYRLADLKTSATFYKTGYRSVNAYSSSKLFLALMCRYLSDKYAGRTVKCFSFDPGIFGSGIYRSRNLLFRTLYRIAAPFMRQPSSVASVMAGILAEGNFEAGAVYDIRKKVRQLNDPYDPCIDEFWRECYEFIDHFLI